MPAGLETAWSIERLRQAAARRLPRMVFDFFEGGAEDEQTLRANLAAYEREPLVPRVMVDVGGARPDCSLLGRAAAMPMAVAPMGAVAYAWHDGDVALACAAAAAGIPYTLSSMAAARIEEIARRAPGRLWFQAHLLQPHERTLALVDRAHAAGFEALVITADLPRGGKRERDLRNGMSMPFRLRVGQLPQFAARPAWSLGMLLHGRPPLPEALQAPASNGSSSIGGGFDPTFNWEDLRRLRDRWPRALVLKGILDPADAAQAVALGVDAIVVSNHGGRQLDGCIATLDALPAVVDAVRGRAAVLLDGGIRRGRDVLKAWRSGADGVLLGRAVLYGVCCAGQPGAAHALQLLRDELVAAMQLAGIASLASQARPRP